jgi:hypothetical protein
MSTFCTSCGNASNGETFCTSCGASVGNATAASPTTSAQGTAENTYGISTEQPNVVVSSDTAAAGTATSSKKKLLLIGAAGVLFIGLGVGGFFAGKSSIDLEKERKISYDKGYSSGDVDGFDRGDSAGYSRGYSAGKIDGCEWVFDQANYASYVTKYDVYGYLMGRFPGSVYVSKTNC